MAENGGTNWRGILWALAKPALVAGIVALLVSLGVTGLRPPYAGELGAASNTSFSGPLLVAGGIRTGNNLTMSTGSLINTSGAVTVSDALNVTGVTSGVAAEWSGLLTATGGITTAGWSRAMGAAWDVGATLAITADEKITPTKSIHYLTDTGGQASGTVTLSAATSIVSGTYSGQLLIVMYTDTAGATMTIKDGANCELPSGSDLALGVNDSALFVWNGTDWICIGSTNN